ncbi:substrate-binding domain-containing protein [Desulfonatronum thioautotrophicum]|uniref:substrate-binding domain-containing protein n=1 Tax=Desulfonatronum thioautotrophicum TaxID=617001 RepID=UPI00069C950F|nr:substrate-binding domain-containing protein [Desulfonatronum thioautotrophicum]
MKREISFLLLLCMLFTSSAFAQEINVEESYGNGLNVFSLATGSPGELGLLRALGETFAAKENARLDWIKRGSGASLKLLQDRKVDMIMVHAPEAEKQAVAEGWAVQRTLIGSNEFFIVGPKSDPANIASAESAADAYRRIAEAQEKFFSRADNSGTHQKELSVWKMAGIEPSGPWYIETKDFMTATLLRANNEQGYFMTDSSTWVAEKNNVPDLVVLFSGDKYLVNTYHALRQPDGATPGSGTAAKFIDFVASEEGQHIMRTYGQDRYDGALYNDAEYASQFIY